MTAREDALERRDAANATRENMREFFADVVRGEVRPGVDAIRTDLELLFPALARQTEPLPTIATLDAFLEVQRGRLTTKGFRSIAVCLHDVVQALDVGDLREATTERMERTLIRLRRERGWKAATFNRRRGELHSLFAWLKSRDLILHNPVTKIARPRVPAAPIRFLTKDEMAALFRATDGDACGHAVRFAIYTGVRRSELQTVTWADVNFAAGPFGNVRINAGKTNAIRHVPIHRELRPVLDELAEGRDSSLHVLRSPSGERWDVQNLSTRIRALELDARLPTWSFLDFRHTFASHLAMKGVPLYAISKLMGNTPDVCRKHYAHMTNESLSALVDF